MEADFLDLLERFTELGGTAENICIRQGELGRGVFPVDPSRRAKIATPKNLLINRSQICISQDEIYVKDKHSQFSVKEKDFIELNYNRVWVGGGNICSCEFLKYLLSIPQSIKDQLLRCGFIDKASLDFRLDESGIFKNFLMKGPLVLKE